MLSRRIIFENRFKVLNKNGVFKRVFIFSPSGYITPFTILLKGDSKIYKLQVKNNGVVDENG